MSFLGPYVKERLASLGLSQKDLAHRLGVSGPIVSDILTGKPRKHLPDGRKIPLASIEQWADALRLDGAERSRFVELAYESHAPAVVRQKIHRLETLLTRLTQEMQTLRADQQRILEHLNPDQPPQSGG